MNYSEIKIENRTVYFRDGTSDAIIINKNFNPNEKPEYVFPQFNHPDFNGVNVVFDIGANIGVTALVLAHVYPKAVIYAFEPETENFDLLVKNTAGLENVRVFNFGLGAKTEKVAFFKSKDPVNFGGYSIHSGGSGAIHQEIDIKSINEFLEAEKINKIDLIKIDCEGAEFDILTALPNAVMANVAWLSGEAHGQFDYELFSHLNKTHYLKIEKPFSPRNYNFHALNRALAPLEWKEV